MKLPSDMHISDAHRESIKRAADGVVEEATRVMMKRSSTSSSAKASCTDSNLCETPAKQQNVQNIAIAMGVM